MRCPIHLDVTVAPPRRINPAKLKQISVGTLAFIPSNSHKLQFLNSLDGYHTQHEAHFH